MKKIKEFIDKCWVKTTAWYSGLSNAAKVALSVGVFAVAFFTLIGFVNLANC